MAADEREQAVARLGERREALEGLECGGQAAAVALAVADRSSAADGSVGACCTARSAAARLGSLPSGVVAVVVGRAGRRRICPSIGTMPIGSSAIAKYRLSDPATRQGLSAGRSARASRRGRARATVSKMPGETGGRRARPAAAGRPRPACTRAARRRRSARPRSARRRRARRAASASRTSRERPAPVLAEPALARRGVVGRPVVDEAAQRPEVGERLQLLGADRGRRAQAGRGRRRPRGRRSARRAPARACSGRSSSAASARRTAPGCAARARCRSARSAPAVERIVSSSPGPSRAARGSCAPRRAGSRASRSSCTEAAPWRLESLRPSGPCSSGRCP